MKRNLFLIAVLAAALLKLGIAGSLLFAPSFLVSEFPGLARLSGSQLRVLALLPLGEVSALGLIAGRKRAGVGLLVALTLVTAALDIYLRVPTHATIDVVITMAILVLAVWTGIRVNA